MRKPIDIIGQRFGRGVVISPAQKPGKKGTPRWRLRCDCGNEYETTRGPLVSGGTKSCGCLRKETAAHNFITYAVPVCTKAPGVAAFNDYLHDYKGNAKARGFAWGLTDEEFRSRIFGDCHYCGNPPRKLHLAQHDRRAERGVGILVNGIDRRNSDLGYTPENAVPCCQRCNQAKRDRSEEDFVAWVTQVYLNRAARSDGK